MKMAKKRGRKRLLPEGPWEPLVRPKAKGGRPRDDGAKKAPFRELLDGICQAVNEALSTYGWRAAEAKHIQNFVNLGLNYAGATPWKFTYISRLKFAIQENGLPAEWRDNAEARAVFDGIMTKLFTRMTREQIEDARNFRKMMLRDRSAEPIVLTTQQVFGVIAETKKNDYMTFEDAFVYLQLTSGCRKVEILDERVSKFELAVPSTCANHERYVVQVGVAKQKRTKKSIVPQKWAKFILSGTPDEWLATLRSFRIQVGDLEQYSRVEVGAKFSKRLLTATKRFFYWVRPRYTLRDADGKEAGMQSHCIGTHFNRAVYGQMCGIFEHALPGNTFSQAKIIQDALTHTQRDSSEYYEAVVLTQEENLADSKRVARLQTEQENESSRVYTDIEGVRLRKFARCWRTEKQKRQLVQDGEELLVENGLKGSFANLLKLGIGSTTISRFHDKELCR